MKRLALAASALVFGAAPALAHLDPGTHGSFSAGLTHPLSGLDHVLAMVAIGLWAAQTGGRALFLVPAAFVTTMTAGFLLGLTGLSLPMVESGVAASVVILGLLVASAARLPLAASAGLAGVFALFHGVAHATELGEAGALSFGLGFVASTVLLHAAGIGLGLLVGRSGRAGSLGGGIARFAGAGTAIAGLYLMAG